MPKTIIVGLGNDILSDDAAGIHVARRLAPLLADSSDVAVVEATVGGMRLIELMSGYESAILVDAIVREDIPPGSIQRFSLADFEPTERLAGFHDISLPTAAAMARELEIPFPGEIEIIAIGAGDTLTVSEEMDSEVEAGVDMVVEMLRDRFAG